MNLRRLRAFLALADELNFRRAAERVAVTQPALSQQIKELEDELGATLFERDRRHVGLTRAGEALLGPVREAMDRLDAAFADVRRLGLATDRTLRLGYVEYMNLPFLAGSLRLMRERYPGIVIEPHELYSAAVVSALAERRIDLGFAFAPLDHPDLALRPLVTGCWMLVLPADHRLAALSPVAVAELAGERLILFARHLNPPLHDALMVNLASAGPEPNVVYRTAQGQLGPSLVAEGVGLFVVASYILRELPTGLVARPLAGFDNRLPLAAVWRGDHRTPAVRAFLDVLAESCGSATGSAG
ncbi:LysR family transcriptional regulator [Methylobacterium oryzisoli]|uniref:LysR family transcriptional regulator n=1 Tax=Methylobacterium oryzisoli TaxID=3385502 RepID=UPI0038911B40